MHLICGSSLCRITPCNKNDLERAKNILLSNRYDFAVFDDYSRTFLLYEYADKLKRSILFFSEIMEYPSPNMAVTISRPHPDLLPHIGPADDIYLSGLGIPTMQAMLFAEKTELKERIESSKGLLSHGRILFYGDIRDVRKRQFSYLKSLGLTVVVCDSKIISSGTSIHEHMLKNDCFACLGIDGLAIPAWRDYELAVAGVPSIRICQTSLGEAICDPCDIYYKTFENDLEYSKRSIEKIKKDLQSGEIERKISQASLFAQFCIKNSTAIMVLDSISRDWQFSRTQIKSMLNNDTTFEGEIVNKWLSAWATKSNNTYLKERYACGKIEDFENGVYFSELRPISYKTACGTIGLNGDLGYCSLRVRKNGIIGPSKAISVHPAGGNDECFVKYSVPAGSYRITGKIALNDTAIPTCPCLFSIRLAEKDIWKGTIKYKDDIKDFSMKISSNDIFDLSFIVSCDGDHTHMHSIWIDPLIRKEE